MTSPDPLTTAINAEELPRLDETHDYTSFASGADELDDWLRSRALKGQAVGNANVYVATQDHAVVGYYALASAGVERESAPGRVRQNAPDTVPCVLLARLAVDKSVQGMGVGRFLLDDALRRCAKVSLDVGFRAVLVHARDDTARSFYGHQFPFQASPLDPLHLFLRTDLLQREVFGATTSSGSHDDGTQRE